jgi:hypothetical protein
MQTVDLNDLQSQLDNLMKKFFKDSIVWEEGGAGLVGRYVYLKYEGDKIGFFIGYLLDNSKSRISACVSFIFPHPSLSTGFEAEEERRGGRLFYKILIRANLRLKTNPFIIIDGRKTPALIRTLFFKDQSNSVGESSLRFFTESINAIKECTPIYKQIA